MVLSKIRSNGDYHVLQITTSDQELNRHLQDMGFLPGEPITVVSHFDGNVIVSVKGSRVALSEQMASHILV